MSDVENIDASKGSSERFGYSWDRFSELSSVQERQFQLWTQPISPESGWRNKRFLDAGCGAGRNSYWPMSYGASSCVSIDLDDRSLDAARANLERYEGAKVEKCSIYKIPYENEFDIAFSIGVVHHLEHPGRAIDAMVKAIKPGGEVLIWVYGYENMEIFSKVLDPLRKILFSRLPLWLVRFLALFPAALLWLLLRLGVMRLNYFKVIRRAPLRHLHTIVFDQMLPKIAHYWRRDEALALLQDAGLENIRIEWINEMSWTVIGSKPDTTGGRQLRQG